MQYEPELKAEVVAYYQDHGSSAAARQFDVSRTSVINWAHDAGVVGQPVDEKALKAAEERRNTKREEAKETLLDIILELQHRLLSPGKAGDTRHLATAMGIVYDKYRLEMGEHTDRQSHVSPVDLELERVLHEFNRQTQTTS